MLPFFDKKQTVAGILMQRGKADLEVKPEVGAPGGETDSGLKQAAEDLLRAIEAKSPIDVASALKSAWMICESYEEDEGETKA